MRKILFILAACLIALASATAVWAFDCQAPPFGARLSDLGDPENFSFYKEERGVSYATYSGDCILNINELYAPLVAFAFVDGRLYARIIRLTDADLDYLKDLAVQVYGRPQESSQEPPFTVYTWIFPDRGVKYKIKHDQNSRVTKSALYYEPLRSEILETPPNTDALDALFPAE